MFLELFVKLQPSITWLDQDSLMKTMPMVLENISRCALWLQNVSKFLLNAVFTFLPLRAPNLFFHNSNKYKFLFCLKMYHSCESICDFFSSIWDTPLS